jgi:hypothetical protein
MTEKRVGNSSGVWIDIGPKNPAIRPALIGLTLIDLSYGFAASSLPVRKSLPDRHSLLAEYLSAPHPVAGVVVDRERVAWFPPRPLSLSPLWGGCRRAANTSERDRRHENFLKIWDLFLILGGVPAISNLISLSNFQTWSGCAWWHLRSSHLPVIEWISTQITHSGVDLNLRTLHNPYPGCA